MVVVKFYEKRGKLYYNQFFLPFSLPLVVLNNISCCSWEEKFFFYIGNVCVMWIGGFVFLHHPNPETLTSTGLGQYISELTLENGGTVLIYEILS